MKKKQKSCNTASLWLKILPHLLFAGIIISVIVPDNYAYAHEIVPIIILVSLLEAVLIIGRKRLSVCGILSVVFGIILIWDFYALHVVSMRNSLFPPPEDVIEVILSDLKTIFFSILSSGVLLIISFAIAFVTGVSVGLAAGKFKRFREALMPIARVLSPIPALIYAPYAVALLPGFRAAAIFIISIGLFFPIMFNIVLAINDFDPKLMDSARVLNLSSGTMLVRVLFPYCVPYLFNTLTVQISNAFLLLVGAEMMGMTSGVGWYVKYHSDFNDYTRVLAGFIVIGILVSIINAGLEKLRSTVLQWKV